MAEVIPGCSTTHRTATCAGLYPCDWDTSSSAVSFIKKHPELMITAEYFFDAVGIMTRENDSNWLDFINFTLQVMWADGKLQKVVEEHFGVAPKWHLWSPYRLQPKIGPGQKRIGDRKFGS